jgi:hypothetical protein
MVRTLRLSISPANADVAIKAITGMRNLYNLTSFKENEVAA